MRLLWPALAALAAFGCTPNPPVSWQEGGAPLLIKPARWDRPSGDPIEIREDGKVMEGDDLLYVIDRAGRVTDKNFEPVAILLPDGHVAGTDNHLLGQVGVSNAAPPGAAAAWLAILPNGQTIHFDEDGDRHDMGVWHGCEGPQKRECTLITHIIMVQDYLSRSRGGVGVGVGIVMAP